MLLNKCLLISPNFSSRNRKTQTNFLLDTVKINERINFINFKHRKISFTVKREENNSLSFLDITFFLLCCKVIHFSLERTTYSSVLNNLRNFLPIFYKFYLASTLLHCGVMVFFTQLIEKRYFLLNMFFLKKSP